MGILGSKVGKKQSLGSSGTLWSAASCPWAAPIHTSQLSSGAQGPSFPQARSRNLSPTDVGHFLKVGMTHSH